MTDDPTSTAYEALRKELNILFDDGRIAYANDKSPLVCEQYIDRAEAAINKLLAEAETRGRYTKQDELLEAELPWPKDIFGEVPTDDWAKINDLLKEHLGYPIDRVSGDLMRHGWKVRQRQLREVIEELKEIEQANADGANDA